MNKVWLRPFLLWLLNRSQGVRYFYEAMESIDFILTYYDNTKEEIEKLHQHKNLYRLKIKIAKS